MKTDSKDIKFLQDPRLRSQERVYDGKLFQVYRNQVEVEQGVQVQRDLVHHLPAVAILATTDQDQVLLVEQYRPATADNIIEVPAGMIEIVDGALEDPLLAAQRELEEETSYRSEDWQEMGRFWTSPGFIDELIILFWARQAYPVDSNLAQDPHENVTHHLLERKQVQDWLDRQEVLDLKTRLALEIWLNKE